MSRTQKSIIGITLFFLSTLILFLGFFNNYWHVLNQNNLQTDQLNSDRFIMGRLVKSGRDGIFSYGGLVGYVRPLSTTSMVKSHTYPYQLQAYLTSMDFTMFDTYTSQIGGQGMFFGLLDRMIHRSPQEKIRLFYLGNSLLSAILLALIILWFFQEFGLTVALFVLVSTVFSQWLVDFGKSLFWSLWAFYLPMVAMAYYLKYKKIPVSRKQFIWFGILIFVMVFIKCLFNGYEFNTTALLMVTVPIAYYCILDRVNFRRLANISATTVLSAVLAVLVSFVILCIQIGSISGGFSKGVDHIIYSFEKRTYADSQDFPDDLTASLKASPASVVTTYLNGIYVDLNNFLPASNTFASEVLYKIKYWYLIVLFALGSFFLYFFRKRPFYRDKTNLVLVCTTWFSILAPLSWYIIFKSHAYVHKMDTIVWQMPFTLFGFAVCGLGFRNFLLDLNHWARYIVHRS